MKAVSVSEYRKRVFEEKKRWRLKEARLSFEAKIDIVERLVRFSHDFRPSRTTRLLKAGEGGVRARKAGCR
jgi:integrase